MNLAIDAFLKGGKINQEKNQQVRQLIQNIFQTFPNPIFTKDDITEFINYIDDPEGSADPQLSIFEIISKQKQLKLGITVFQTVIQSFREAVKDGIEKP